jgi:hypothetical protein
LTAQAASFLTSNKYTHLSRKRKGEFSNNISEDWLSMIKPGNLLEVRWGDFRAERISA